MSPLHVDDRLKPYVQKQLASIRASAPTDGERRVTTVHSAVLQNVQIRADVEGHRFVSDEPQPKAGHDAGPAPLRYFLGGVMMCHQVWVVKAAAVRDLALDRVEGEIDAFIGGVPAPADGSRPFSRIEYRLEVDASCSPEQLREILDDAEANCPAVATVRAGTRFDVIVTFNGATLG